MKVGCRARVKFPGNWAHGIIFTIKGHIFWAKLNEDLWVYEHDWKDGQGPIQYALTGNYFDVQPDHASQVEEIAASTT